MADPTPVIPPHAPPPPPPTPDVAPQPDDLLGEPGPLGTVAPGDADDLIARMADQQIDQLLADDEAGRPRAEVPRPPIEDDVIVAPRTEPPAPPSTPIESVLSAADAAAVDEPAVTFPASFSPPQSKRASAAEPIDAAAPKLELPPLDAAPLDAPPEHELQSSADAVARELADDARLAPLPADDPTPNAEPAPRSDVVTSEAASPGERLMTVPMTLLDWVNYPVRSMSDAAREAMGAVAIVTLANATALLIYLVLFRA